MPSFMFSSYLLAFFSAPVHGLALYTVLLLTHGLALYYVR